MRTPGIYRCFGMAVGLLLYLPCAMAQLSSASFPPAAEATIYDDFVDGNGGGHDRICIGNIDSSGLRRAYLKYDVSIIPLGSKVTRVALNMEQFRIRSQGPGTPKPATLMVHRVTSNWEEGEGLAVDQFNIYIGPECGLATPTTGDEITWNNSPGILATESARIDLPTELNWLFVMDSDEGARHDGLIDDVQSWVNGRQGHGWRLSVLFENRADNARLMIPGELIVEWEEPDEIPFAINPGFNDAWYNRNTDGQGIFIIVYPDIQLIFLAWFTYEADAQGGGVPTLNAVLGDDEHRWLTASAFYEEGDQSVELDVTITSGGKFDAGDPVHRETDGNITLNFEHCDKVVVEYNIPSVERSGLVELERVAKDNVPLCEALTLQNN